MLYVGIGEGVTVTVAGGVDGSGAVEDVVLRAQPENNSGNNKMPAAPM
jgi:hypothetical protein